MGNVKIASGNVGGPASRTVRRVDLVDPLLEETETVRREHIMDGGTRARGGRSTVSSMVKFLGWAGLPPASERRDVKD